MPEEEFKRLESLNDRLRNELQDTWNVLKEYKLTMKDNQGGLFSSVLECVKVLVSQVGEAQNEVNKVFVYDGRYDPGVHNVARRVRELREDRDKAVECLLRDRETLRKANDEVLSLRKRMKKQGNTQHPRQVASSTQESIQSPTESEAVPQGQQLDIKTNVEEDVEMDNEDTDLGDQPGGKEVRLA